MPPDRPPQERPEQYLIADFDSLYPYEYSHGPIIDGKLSVRAHFVIYGIIPGDYCLKACWRKTARDETLDKLMSPPRPGDYESDQSPVVTIAKGNLTEGIHIDCTTLVGR